MKRKLILTNTVIVTLSLLLMLVISILVINNVDNDQTYSKARNYLSYASETYNGSNERDISSNLNIIDSNIRVTFVNSDGMVIYDSSNLEIDDNHLERDEIKNPGVIYKRYSDTLKQNMLYVASFIDDYNIYVRISIPTSRINTTTSTYLAVGFILLFVILALSTTSILYFTKKTIDPINLSVKELAKISGKDIANPDIDDIADIISSTNLSINDKIRKIELEKDKLKDVLNEISNGIILLDSRANIGIINNKALEIFGLDYDKIIGKNMVYLIRDLKLQQEINEAISSKSCINTKFDYNNNSYSVIIKYIEADWTTGAVIGKFSDVTKEMALERTKREFFANASHELKSPLTSIIGYLQMVKEGIVDDMPTIIDYSNRSLSEAQRMNNIIIDMLDLSKYEANEDTKVEEVNVSKVLHDIINSLDSKISEKNIKVDIDEIETKIISDYNHIYELIRNLVDNAIKYNKDNGNIYITLNNNFLEIKDTGIGIPLDEQERVFERFYRVDKAKSKTLGGTGLGLAIVKHICEIHGYQIKLKSIENVGTTITIIFNNEKEQ